MNISIKRVNVKYNSKLVGTLLELRNGKIGFEYDKEWLKNGFSISPFSLPLEEKVFISNKDLFFGLFGVFFDSLPDGWGLLLLNRYLIKNGISLEKISPLTRLTIINSNGLGALTYEPIQSLCIENDKYNLDKLSLEVNNIINDNDYKDLDEVYLYGGSSGGARPKAHIKIDNEEWIVKFPCRIDPIDIGLKEYKANLIAKECGINVNEFKLFDSKICSGYFGSKRFDREDGRKIHVISLAGILETTHRIPNLDYGHLLNVVQTLNGDKEELYEVYRRMCFNVLYNNKDDHSKNFSFLYDEKNGKYILAPAYDLTRTYDKLEHEMTVNGNENPTEEDMLILGEKFQLSKSKCIKIINLTKEVIKKYED